MTIEVAGARTILRDPVFARLWFIQAANQIGGNMALYALTVLVFSSTRSNSAVSALLVSFVLPQIVLSPFAGVIVDRLDLRWALIVPNVIRTALTAGLALAGHEHRDGPRAQSRREPDERRADAGGGLDDPAGRPESAARDRDERLQPDAPGSFAIGFAFLGPLMTTMAGPSFVLGVVTAFYVAASIACIGLPSAPPVEPPALRSGARSLHDPIDELREGSRWSATTDDQPSDHPAGDRDLGRGRARRARAVAGGHRRPRARAPGRRRGPARASASSSACSACAGSVNDCRDGGSRRSACSYSGRDRPALPAPVARRSCTASAYRRGAPVVIVTAMIAGAAYAVTSVTAQTNLTKSMPADVRGRVFGVLASIVSAASLIPSLVTGPLADRLSTGVAIAIAGLILVAVALWSIRRRG